MKLSKAKIKRIEDILDKFIEIINVRVWDGTLKQKALQAIIKAVEGYTVRSLEEHRKYMALCSGIADNYPEILLRANGLDKASTEYVHSVGKCKFKLSSTAFDNLDQDSFHTYHVEFRIWTATYILNCHEDELDEKVKKKKIEQSMDELTKEYIDD